MLQFFFFPISLIFLIIASYTDLKERIVANKLNFFMLCLGIIGHALLAFFQQDLNIILICIEAVIIAFGFSWILWKMGVWAGGDVKLFTAIASLNPANPAMLYAFEIINLEIFSGMQLPLFAVTLFVFSVFAMVPYGAIISIARLSKNNEVKKEFFAKIKKRFLSGIEYASAITGIGAVLLFLQTSLWIGLPLLIIFGFIRWKNLRRIIALLVFCFAIWQDWQNALSLFFVLLAVLMGMFFLFSLYFLSKKLLRKKIKIKDLEEGMIPAETIIENKGIVSKAKEFEIKKVINLLTHNRIKEMQKITRPEGRIIISSSRARGLIKQEIEELKKLEKEKKIENAILIKESAPMVPAVLIGYIIAALIGDLLWNILF